jgi:hypothetical protein
MRVIRSADRDVMPILPSSRAELRELRFAPAGCLLAMTTFIYGNKVVLFLLGAKATALSLTVPNLLNSREPCSMRSGASAPSRRRLQRKIRILERHLTTNSAIREG